MRGRSGFWGSNATLVGVLLSVRRCSAQEAAANVSVEEMQFAAAVGALTRTVHKVPLRGNDLYDGAIHAPNTNTVVFCPDEAPAVGLFDVATVSVGMVSFDQSARPTGGNGWVSGAFCPLTGKVRL